MIYYNTTHLSGQELKRAIEQAKKQEDAVMLLFENTGREYSPSQVMKLMVKAGWDCPITSWRRAITNLTKSGRLRQTSEQVIGMYGRPEFKWSLG